MSFCRALLAVFAILFASSCAPWTIVPIESQAGERHFDAAAYVDSIWNSKVIPAALSAPDLREVLSRRDGPQCVLVKCTGRVLRVDNSSRSRLLLIDLPPYDGQPDIAVQIGPVIRGTALRDALPFIQFSQFVNQLEFARVGNELNAKVEKIVLPPLQREGLEGTVISLSGALTRQPGDTLPEIVPLKLQKPGTDETVRFGDSSVCPRFSQRRVQCNRGTA